MKKCVFCCTLLENVCVKKDENVLLDHINLHLHCNQITAIIGPNGAGKTTLFKSILGEIPYTGSIHYATHKEGSKKFAPIIGYVPQYLNFDNATPISVLDLFAACMQKKPVWLPINQGFKEKVKTALSEVELEYALDRKIGALSGGELQRVLLALALMPMPDLLLLDEPVSGVDNNGKKLFYETVIALKKRHHMAIVIITHDLQLLEAFSDHVVLLHKKILCEGTPKEVLENKQTKQIFYLG